MNEQGVLVLVGAEALQLKGRLEAWATQPWSGGQLPQLGLLRNWGG